MHRTTWRAVLGALMALLTAVLVAGCTVSKTETGTTSTNCSLGGCDTTSKSSPPVGLPVLLSIVLGAAVLGRRLVKG